MEGCTDDHSNGEHCPVHGYDDSVPAPPGFKWHRLMLQNGQVYSALIPAF